MATFDGSTMSNLRGKRICITGKLEGTTRKEIERAVKNNGGTLVNSAGWSTHYLVVGKRPGGRKTREAHNCNTAVITPEQFDTLITTGTPY